MVAWLEDAETVGHEDAVIVGIQADFGGEDVIGSVGDKNGVVTGVESALVLDEVEQVGHLFEVRGDIGVIASEVHVVEFNVDDMFDLAVQLTLRPSR